MHDTDGHAQLCYKAPIKIVCKVKQKDMFTVLFPDISRGELTENCPKKRIKQVPKTSLKLLAPKPETASEPVRTMPNTQFEQIEYSKAV